MKCEDARKLLTTPLADLKGRDAEVQEALQHVLKCDACFAWSLHETEKIRQAAK
jgi:hypothetical protein